MIKINTGCSFLHPLTGQMIHPGQTYEDNPAQVIKQPEDIAENLDDNQDDHVTPQLTIEDFLKLGADEQKHKLVEFGIVSVDDDESVSNKEKRASLYEKYLGGGVNDGKGTATDTASEA